MKYFIVLIILFSVLLVIYCFKNKVHIKWHTFKNKGFAPALNKYGVYCYCGKQGSGKTYSVMNFLFENRDMIIYANLKSINSDIIKYKYIANLKEMLELRSEHDILIFFDEIFTEISKLLKTDNKLAKDILDFLSQMRKRRIILLTTCQEWRLLPLYFRLYVRYQVNCKMFRFPILKGIVIKNFINGDDIKWSEEEQDFVGELVENTVEHTQLVVANLYDTFEQIGEYSNYSDVDVSNVPREEELKNADMAFWEDLTIEDIACQVTSESDTPLGQHLTRKRKNYNGKQVNET